MHFSRADIEKGILAGQTLVVYRGSLLRISSSWLDKHPGGALAILHYVGRDASDEIEAYHDDQALALLKRFVVGTVELDKDGLWLPFLPPVMSGWVRRDDAWFNEAALVSACQSKEPSPTGILVKCPETTSAIIPALCIQAPPSQLSLKTQGEHSAAFRVLHQRIIDAGLYETPFLSGYLPEAARITLLGCVSAYAFSQDWQVISALCLGVMWSQLVFTVHDLGHMGVTHNWYVDRVISIILADFIGGLSIGWWVDNHNVHHLVTNHPNHDPDIEHIPVMAISPVYFNGIWSSYNKHIMQWDKFSAFMVSVQHKVFYFILAFGRFNLYRMSYLHLFTAPFKPSRTQGGRWAWALEVTGIIFWWCWYAGIVLVGCGSLPRAVIYVLVSHCVNLPLHVQFVLSHYTMSTEDLGPLESFPHRQLRTTTDVTCHPNLQFLHGGLHLQVSHHLFPRLPRHNLSKASMLVKEYAQEQGLVYAELGFRQGNRKVVGILKGVADQVRLLGMVASGEAQEALEQSLASKQPILIG